MVHYHSIYDTLILMASHTLGIHLFGPLRLIADKSLFPFSSLPKTLPLLAYLLLYREAPIPRDTLAFTLWPDVTEREALTNLRRHLHNLQKALPETTSPWVIKQNSTLQWNPEAHYWLDVAAFEQLCSEPNRLEEAIEIYTDDLLPEIYDDWLSFERKRLQNLYTKSLSKLGTEYRQQGNYEKALTLTQRLLQQDPWSDKVIREMMMLHYLMGDRAGALREYQQFKETLRAELDIPPMPETESLSTTIQRGELLPEAGENPQVEIESPKQPLNDIPHHIPTPLRPIIGREADIADILTLIGGPEPSTRLLTLVGPGGVGKTRLVLETASRILYTQPEHFPDGIFFIPLAALTNHILVLPTLAEVLDIQIKKGQARQTLIENFRYRKMLLLLDNFEHLIAAAPDIAALMQASPGLRVLVTSQIGLSLYGEQEYPVVPLALPELHPNISLDELRAAPSVRLFEERAQALSPHFVLDEQNAFTVVEICAQLDGLPLALELAAARVRLYSPEGILAQLADRLDFLTTRTRDMPDRHRNLRAALEWSVNLLTPKEKELFTRLAIFPGGFSAEAVHAILMAYESLPQTLEALELLQEKNIIQVETPPPTNGPRFFMLAALRVFAQEFLQEDAEFSGLKSRFVQYHATLFQEAYEGLKGSEQKTWLKRIQLEINNLRTSLEWAFEPPGDEDRVPLGADILRAIQKFWPAKGMFQEGLVWVEKALAYREKIPNLEVLATLFYLAGNYAQYQGMFEQAQTYTEEGLHLARQIDQPQTICNGLQFLAMVVGRQGNYQRAASLLREAIEMECTNHPGQKTHNLAVALNNLGLVLKNLGDYEGAAALLEEKLTIDQANGNRMGMAAGLTNMGDLAISQENYSYARTCYRQALEIRLELGDTSGIIKSITGMANLAIVQEQFIRSAQLYAANLRMRQQMNYTISPQLQPILTANLSRIRAALAPEEFEAAWTAGEAMTMEDAVAYALEE